MEAPLTEVKTNKDAMACILGDAARYIFNAAVTLWLAKTLGTMHSIMVFSWKDKKRVIGNRFATLLMIRSTLIVEAELPD